MTRQLLAAVAALTSTFAFAAVDRTPVDAFLSRADRRPVPGPAQLDARTRDAVRQGYVTGTEARLGVPTFFWGPGRVAGVRPFKAQGLSAEQAARRFLYAHAGLYRGTPARWAEAALTRLHDLGDGGAVIATFQQKVRGLELFRDEVKVIMTKDLELVALSGYLTPETKVRGDFRLAPEQAVGLAFESVLGRPLRLEGLTELEPAAGSHRYSLAGEPTPVRVKPVYFPLPEGLVPGFYVELDVSAEDGEVAYFSFVVSAVDGALLFKKDLTAWDFSYRVWATADGLPMDGPQGNDPSPHPTGTVNAYAPPFVPPVLMTLNHGPISTMDPWLAPGASTTSGNNVFAYVDAVRSNGYGTGDFLPTTTSTDSFDRVYDIDVNPDDNAEQRMAAATQLFYNTNFFHDWYYDVGFDEAAGNAQNDNFSRGGQGGDAMRAEGQDYSGRNNANMSTPSDGASPRMQMYIFDAQSSASLTVTGGTPANPSVGVASFGPRTFDVTADLILADDGSTANSGTVTDACEALTNAVTGKIVLIDRGVCQFATKVANAQAAGAIGVIIANNRTGNTPPALSGTSSTVTIPSLSVTQTTGTSLKSSLTAGTVSVRMKRDATVDRDGTIDNAIVAHEWGHYISNRLIGDGNGLSNNQAVGMGEGWADFHAMLMVVKAADNQVAVNTTFNGVYALAAYTSYASDPNGYYFGIRRVPYSTDFTKNALTFKHIQQGVALPSGVPVSYGASGNYNAEVHSIGEVWCSMLWEVYAALLNDSRYTFAQAQDLMKRYLVGGYKATALMPTFTDARDALLAVAAARDPQDFVLMWQAFGRRGLGMLAVPPPRDSTTNNPTVESFDVGNSLVVTDITLNDAVQNCDADGRLDNDEVGNLSITIRNIGISALTQTTATVGTTSPGVMFPGGQQLTFPSIAPFATATVALPVGLRGVSGVGGVDFDIALNDPTLVKPGPIDVTANFRVNYDVMPNGSATDDVESPASPWTVGNDPGYNTGSDWRIFQSAATEHWWFGPNPASPADTFVVSPQLTVSSTQPLVITFRHRYDFEEDATTLYDGGMIEVSTDGTTWTDVGQYVTPGYDGQLSNQGLNPLGGRVAFAGQSANYPAFVNATLDLGTRYAGQTVQLRFRIGADDAAAAKGWEIDDIVFSGVDNKPFSSVVVDGNTCTNAPPVITLGPDQTVPEGTAVTLEGSAYDPNGDQVTLTWTQKSGPIVTLNGNQFTAPQVDADTPMAFDLTATDGTNVVGPKTLTVTVQNVNGAPTVTAPAMLQVEEGQSVTIVATGADPDGDALTYAWTQVGGPAGTLSGEATDSLLVTAPVLGEDGLMAFEVTVTDGTFTSAPAHVDLVVKHRNVPPVSGDLGKPASGCGCTTPGMDLAPMLFGLVALLGFRRRK